MKNKLLHFALDLFSDSDDEEQDSIFAQVKIYRTTSVRIFEYVIGILLLAIWLLTIGNIIHAAAEEWHTYLIVAVFGTVSVGLSFRHSYHPSANDLPFVKIVNARQVYCLSLCSRLQSVVFALFFIWGGCAEWIEIESESIFLGGMITCLALLVLNCIFFTYKIYKLRKLVEVEAPLAHCPERETPHRRHIGVVHSCRVRSTLYSVLGQSARTAVWSFEGLCLHSPDCRHHLGWQQILRSFPRNRQREF